MFIKLDYIARTERKSLPSITTKAPKQNGPDKGEKESRSGGNSSWINNNNNNSSGSRNCGNGYTTGVPLDLRVSRINQMRLIPARFLPTLFLAEEIPQLKVVLLKVFTSCRSQLTNIDVFFCVAPPQLLLPHLPIHPPPRHGYSIVFRKFVKRLNFIAVLFLLSFVFNFSK